MLGIDNSERYPEETEPKGKEAKSNPKQKNPRNTKGCRGYWAPGVIETDFTANTLWQTIG